MDIYIQHLEEYKNIILNSIVSNFGTALINLDNKITKFIASNHIKSDALIEENKKILEKFEKSLEN